jgi:hypothetical protein
MRGAGAAAPPTPRRVDPKLKLYNMIRWMNYLLFPLTGIIIIIIGVVIGIVNGLHNAPYHQETARTLIIGGGILAYVSIFYNKR